MHEITHKRNDSGKKDNFLSPIFKNIFDDDFFSTMNYVNGVFKVDVKELSGSYIIEADLPGIKKEYVDISLENNYLVITARRNESSEDQKGSYIRRERHFGEFRRSIYVDNIDPGEITATFNDGVLRIVLPMQNKDNGKRKKIDIQ